MSLPREHLEELLRLPLDERSAAAEELLASLEDEADPDAPQAWVDEIVRRAERQAPGVPATQVFEEARERFKGGR